MSTLSDEEIISKVAYHNTYLEEKVTLIVTPALDPDTGPLEGTGRESLGKLSKLPLDVLDRIFSECTLHALVSFGYLNRFATRLIIASSPYKHIALHAPNLLATLLQTDAAFYFTARQVYDALCSPGCYNCGQYGQLLFMPLCVRCCQSCLVGCAKFRLISPEVMEATYGVTIQRLRHSGIPMIRFLPGQMSRKYEEIELEFAAPRIVMSDESAWGVAMRFHGKEDTLMRYVNRRPKAKALHEARTGEPNPRSAYDHLDIRLRATTLLPYLDRATQTLEDGLLCKGCEAARAEMVVRRQWDDRYWAVVKRRNQVHSRKSFLEHVKACEDAQDILFPKPSRESSILT